LAERRECKLKGAAVEISGPYLFLALGQSDGLVKATAFA
jgi:hypothetical protein